MTSKKKPFSSRLYWGNDLNAKLLSKQLIQKLYEGVEVIEPMNKYDIDLVITKDHLPIAFAECEIKSNWKGSKFPFKTIHFPYRKKKFTMKKLPTIFIMFNRALNRCLVVDSEDVKGSPTKEVQNKLVKEGEMFYTVPVGKAKFYEV